MTVLFSNSNLKIHKSGIFGPKFSHFCFLCEILQIDEFEGDDFKCDNIAFKLQLQNIQIRHFWSRIYAFLFFHEILEIENLEGADFKYDNRFSKILAQK